MRTCMLIYLYTMHVDGYITLLHYTNIIIRKYIHTYVNAYLHAIMHITDHTYNCGNSFIYIYISYTNTKSNYFDVITHLLTHRHIYIHILKYTSNCMYLQTHKHSYIHAYLHTYILIHIILYT